jgi:hypothetical protein
MILCVLGCKPLSGRTAPLCMPCSSNMVFVLKSKCLTGLLAFCHHRLPAWAFPWHQQHVSCTVWTPLLPAQAGWASAQSLEWPPTAPACVAVPHLLLILRLLLVLRLLLQLLVLLLQVQGVKIPTLPALAGLVSVLLLVWQHSAPACAAAQLQDLVPLHHQFLALAQLQSQVFLSQVSELEWDLVDILQWSSICGRSAASLLHVAKNSSIYCMQAGLIIPYHLACNNVDLVPLMLWMHCTLCHIRPSAPRAWH